METKTFLQETNNVLSSLKGELCQPVASCKICISDIAELPKIAE